MVVELYPHQKLAISKLSNGKILCGNVGSGKSLTALGYYLEKEHPKDLYIITPAKKRDNGEWIDECAKLNIDYDRVVIDSWHNIQKYENIVGAFFVLDEQKLSGKGEWVKSFLKLYKHNTWIMLSATPGDTWLDYIPIFVGNGFYKNRSEFLREHVVFDSWTKFPKVNRYLSVNKLVRYRNELLVEMPYFNPKKRITKYVSVDHDKELFGLVVKRRWNPYKNLPLKDVAELFRIMRKVVNSDQSRLDAVCTLMQVHPKIIVFYNFDYELEMLRTLGDLVCVREYNGHKHEEIPLEEERWVYLVNYLSGSEAWNCIETNAIIFYSLTYSYKNFEQAKGRIDRISSSFEELFYYALVSDSKIDKLILNALEKKRNFSEKKSNF